MQKELDKIERFASEVTEKSKMNKDSADNLLISVKVNRICTSIIPNYCDLKLVTLIVGICIKLSRTTSRIRQERPGNG